MILGATSAIDSGSTSLIQAASTGGARIILARNDTTTAQNDSLGRIRFYGNDSDGNYDECARLEVIADADHTSTSKASAITVHTTASGAESSTERLRITSPGEVRVGSAFSVSQAGVCTAAEFHGDGSNLTNLPAAGITTQVGTGSGIITSVFLSDAQDHKITATGFCTITSTQAGTEGASHTIRIVNSGIATVGFSTYFLFPSGAAPSLPTADGAISLISFTVHDSVGAGCTQLLAGASVNYS